VGQGHPGGQHQAGVTVMAIAAARATLPMDFSLFGAKESKKSLAVHSRNDPNDRAQGGANVRVGAGILSRSSRCSRHSL